ncbi:unnamed protein product [Cyprideis torosa]|uniref:Uncharacterized protein n=1 Tax=Cyprideis torosa TaxID=163714 RepID=A0A7R8ZTX8_9CRUS|nr:unnamed protein product [Cyprideis torosa]CAG0904995.1 unnamed protein product [Cyprideis torosa]
MFSLWQIWTAVDVFMEVPRATSIRVVQKRSLPFPAVTICPLAPYKTKRYYKDLQSNASTAVFQDSLKIIQEIDLALKYIIYSPLDCSDPLIYIRDHLVLKGYTMSDKVKEFIKERLVAAAVAESERFDEYGDGYESNTSYYDSLLNTSYYDGDYDLYKDATIEYEGDPLGLLLLTVKQDMSDFIFALKFDANISDPDEIMFEASDVIESCQFKSQDCIDDFHRIDHPQWKNCFSFNHKYLRNTTTEDPLSRLTSAPGRAVRVALPSSFDFTTDGYEFLYFFDKQEGLKVLLKVDQLNYVDFLSEFPGYAVSVSDPTMAPDLNSNFIVEEAKTLDLALKMTEINLLEPGRGGSCLEADAWKDLFPDYTFRCDYQSTVCTQLEQILQTKRMCNCTKSNDILGTIVEEEGSADIDPCSKKHRDCVLNVLKDLMSTMDQKCPPECHKVEYSVTPQTMNTKGLSVAESILIKQMRENELPGPVQCLVEEAQIFSEETFESKFARLNVYYQQLVVEELKEDPIYTVLEFLFDWIGLAFHRMVSRKIDPAPAMDLRCGKKVLIACKSMKYKESPFSFKGWKYDT